MENSEELMSLTNKDAEKMIEIQIKNLKQSLKGVKKLKREYGEKLLDNYVGGDVAYIAIDVEKKIVEFEYLFQGITIPFRALKEVVSLFNNAPEVLEKIKTDIENEN